MPGCSTELSGRGQVWAQHGRVRVCQRQAATPLLSRRPIPDPLPLLDPARAIRRTRMIRMMVGLMGSAALISISSSVMPMTDSSTMASPAWVPTCAKRAGVRCRGREALEFRYAPAGRVSQPSPSCHGPQDP